MIAYAESASCLRATILRYSAIPWRASRATRAAPAIAANGSARPITSCCGRSSRELRASRPYGRRRIAALLVRHTEGLPEDLMRLSTKGLPGAYEPRLIERWIESACAAGLIAVSADRYRTLTLTAVGRAVMAGRIEEVQMLVPAAARRVSVGQRRRRRQR